MHPLDETSFLLLIYFCPYPSQVCCTGVKALLMDGTYKGCYSLHRPRLTQMKAQMALGDSWPLSWAPALPYIPTSSSQLDLEPHLGAEGRHPLTSDGCVYGHNQACCLWALRISLRQSCWDCAIMYSLNCFSLKEEVNIMRKFRARLWLNYFHYTSSFNNCY